MYLRLWSSLLPLFAALVLCGCFPSTVSQNDEQNNEYYKVGKERANAADYKGAIEAFEKAAEINPRSALAHFELGVLYEKYGEQKESDYVSAMYHYLQVIRHRPNEYPADNARQRITACKQELVKTELLAPVEQALIRERDRLKEENQDLRRQLEAALAGPQTPSRPGPGNLTGPPGGRPQTGFTPMVVVTNRTGGSPQSNSGSLRPTPLPTPGAGRTYTIKKGDTLYSISRQMRVTVDALAAANPGINPKKLPTGQVLKVPDASR